MDIKSILRHADGNVYDALRARFPTDRHRLLFETVDGRKISYGDAERLIGRMSRLMTAAGIRPGDRVAGILEKSPEGFLLYLAASRIGAVYMPIHIALTLPEIVYILEDAEPTLVVCDTELIDRLQKTVAQLGRCQLHTLDSQGSGTLIEACSRLAEDAFGSHGGGSDSNAIVYTSGTTGKPKGAILTNGLVVWNALVLADRWKMGFSDVLLHANPMAYGLFGTTIPTIAGGGTIRLLPKFDVNAVVAALPGATVFAGVPTYYNRLLAQPAFDANLCRNMRLFITGSAPMRANLFVAFNQRTGHVLLDRYGSTEGLIITSNFAQLERRAETSGTVLDGSLLRIVNDDGQPAPVGHIGRIHIRQPYPFAGYWKAPQKTADAFTDDGWFVTGDFGCVDESGFVSVLGRGIDLIISGGFNVYPKEVETAINTFANVAESAVIGVPHVDFGEAVVAVIELSVPAHGLDVASLMERLRQKISPYKLPKHVDIVPELPRNTLGKIEKQKLKDQRRALFESLKHG